MTGLLIFVTIAFITYLPIWYTLKQAPDHLMLSPEMPVVLYSIFLAGVAVGELAMTMFG